MYKLLGRDTLSRTSTPLQTFLFALAVLLVGLFLGSTIFGAYLNYSPVPMLDSWTGMVGFYLKSLDSPLAWWAQHNDHRIFFSKLLFWLDMRYFGGVGLVLIPANVILLLLTWWMLATYASRLINFSSLRERFLVWAILGMLCLAWMQNQNITFSFQSQFILVYLLPLLSFYCHGRALESDSHSLRWRALSLFLGVASAHCMVNGIFALPMLALLSWYSERSPRWFLLTVLCAAISLAVFLVGYKFTVGSDFGNDAIVKKPWLVIGFALVYLGGPFYIIFGKIALAMAVGGLAVVLTTYLFLRRSVYRSNPFALALFAYIGYVFATAGMTAYGRVFFPLSFAASGRYLTPTLIMWGALLILLLSRSRHAAQWSGVALAVVAALLLPTQIQAFKINTDMYTPQVKAVAALSLQLGIEDMGAKNKLSLFYNADFEDSFQRARKSKVSIFAEKYAYPANQIGKPLQDVAGEPCAGQITYREQVDQKHAAYLVGGALAQGAAATYRYILFGDAQGLVMGVAIPGRDMAGPGGNAGPLNFDGYLLGQSDFAEMRCVH